MSQQNITKAELERRTVQLGVLSNTSREIATAKELGGMLDKVLCLVQESFGYHHIGLYAVDHEQGELAMQSKAGDFTYLFPSDYRLKLNQGIVGWVGVHGERLLANDVDAESRYTNPYPDDMPTRSELCVPIRIREGTIGALDVQSSKINAFDENDVMVMEALADQIAMAFENARLYEALTRQTRKGDGIHRGICN